MGKKLLFNTLWILLLIPALVLGQTCPTSVSISSNISSPTCQPTNSVDVTYTATANGGTGAFLYQWKINGANEGAPTTDNIFSTTLQNGQTVSVTVTDAGGTTCSVSNNGSPITINVQKTPTVDFQIPPGTKCIGQNITLQASNVNGGSNPNYEWFVDGASVQSSTSSKLIRSYPEGKTYSIRVVLTSTIDCYTSQTAEITKTMVIAEQATIYSTSPDITQACLNTSISPITFSVGGSATGATVSGLPPGLNGNFSNGTFTITGSPTSTGTYNYALNTTGPCASVSSGGTITVPSDATLSLSSGDTAQTVCQGEAISNISYSIGETGTTATVTGLPSGISGSVSGNNLVISGSSTIVGTHNFSVIATGSCGDSETLNGSIIINENLTPSVSISSSDTDNEICAGTEITFTASATNEGSNPLYQWKINGSNSGGATSSNNFVVNNLNDQDIVSVQLTSSEICTTSNPVSSNEITTTVLDNLDPSVIIEASDTDFCQGDSVTFTATPTNGGSPTYQWKINGNNVTGSGATFTTDGLNNGEEVSVVMTSTAKCATSSTATSNVIEVIVNPNLTPEVSIASNDDDNIICSGDSISFTASSINGGSAPTYEWFVDGSSVGNNNATFTTTTLSDGQAVKVIMTSNEGCLASNQAESEEIIVEIDNPLSAITPVFDYTNPDHNKTAICPVTTVTYKINPIVGARNYNWTYPSGWTVESQNANEIVLKANVNASGGQITVTATNNCGSSQTITETVTTGTAVLVDAGPDQNVCIGTNSINLAGQIGGAISQGKDFNWTVSVSGGTLSNQTGNNASNKLNATYTLPANIRDNGGTITFTISSEKPAGQCAIKTDEMVLTVLKNATISDPVNKNQTVCIDTPIDAIEFNITDAGTDASASGLPAGLSGVFSDGIFTISGTPTEAGEFDYTVTTSGDCTGQQTSQTGTITVDPNNTITDATNINQTTCINSAIADISFPINSSVSSVDITGVPAGISGSVVGNDFVITGTPTESGTFTYILNTIGSCVSASTTGTLTVNPDVTISTPTNKDQSICINTPVENIEFSITAPGSNAEVTGLPAGLSGSYNNGIFTISGTATEPGTFDYEVNTIGDCVQINETGTITVTPDPTAEISYSGEYCTSQGGSFDDTLTGTGDYEGGTYSATPEGLIIDATTGEITPGSSLPKTYVVRYEGPEVCNRAIATTEVIINEKPFVEISYKDPFCTSVSDLQSPTFENGTGNYEGGTFYAEPAGLSIDPATGQINPQLTNPTTSPQTYDVYYRIDAADSCSEVIVNTSVTITQIPQITISYPEIICNSETSIPVTITGEAGAYENGTYSAGAGLEINENGLIDPSASVPGEYTVVYTILSADGCEEVVASSNFTIKDQPIITTAPVNTGVCSNSPASFEVIASGDDLTYAWYKIVEGNPVLISGENNSTLNFSNVTAADALEYYVVVSGDNSCTEATSSTFTLNVDEDITITEPSEDLTICKDEVEEVNFTFIASAGGSPLTYQWFKDGEPLNTGGGVTFINSDVNGEYTSILNISEPELDDSGVYWVEVNGPDYFTCSEGTSNSFSFSVKEAEDPPTAEDVIYCLNDDAEALTATVNGDNLIKWYDADYNELGDTVVPPTNEAKTITYYVTQTKEYPTSNGYVVGCESGYTQVNVTILNKPEPVSAEALEFEYCFGEEASEAISLNPAEGATINWYDSVDATSAISAPTPNTSTAAVTTYYVSQTISYEGSVSCESDRTEVIVRVKDLPTVNVDITEGESTICLGSTVTLNATGAESYIWSEGEAELGTIANIDITPNTIGQHTYTVVGTTNGCTNSYDVTINVDDNSVAGTLEAPERLCISNSSATLTLSGNTGDIIRWEYKSASTSDTWTDVGDGNLAAERTFNNLTEDTSFRVTVQNGVCSEDSVEATIIIDELPLGGEALWSKNNERLFLTCVNPVSGYASSLVLSGHVGEIAGWEYRGTSTSSWTTINTTDATLTASQIEAAVSPGDETTVFRALLTNNSCTEGVYSETALVSVIQAEIKPTPVEVDKDVICIGETISLSSETGYSTTGEKFEGGQFTEAGIKNKGWDFTQPDGTVNDYDAAANNGRADHWLKMNASGGEDGKVYTGTLPDYNSASTIQWTSELNVNEKFALVTGDNDSYMETPVFALTGMDEAIFTWDQGYNLSAGAKITVEISTNSGASYNSVLYTLTSDGSEEIGSSGNYKDFGGGTPEDRPNNKMVVDLGDYIGQSNLRIRFNYEGARDGDVWAVDNIKVPEGPQDILLQWYYDDDLTDPDSYLEPIGEVNQYTVNFIPRKIGWNDFEVQTRIILDSNGDECQSVDNFETIRVWAFDQYTTTTEAIIGTCGSSSVTLNASVYATSQAKNITEYPTLDGYVGSWKVSDLNGNEVTTGFTFTNQDDTSVLEPINDPNAIFEADDLGSYRFEWILTPTAVDENDILIDNSGCPPIVNNNEVTLIECTTLDFDGIDDYVDLSNNYTGNYFIEAWIRPFERDLPDGGKTNPNTGSIISGAGFDISMDKISAYFTADEKWHHIAVSNNGQLYIDGISRGSITMGGSAGSRTLIGARWNNSDKTTENHFSGWIEEVRIWNTAPTPKQLRFMMNQRLKLDATGTVVNPLQGETVPNLFIDNLSSYHTDGTHNLDAENTAFYNIPASNLVGYYRLISENPDPLGLVNFPAVQQPSGGTTPDHSLPANKVPGVMHNIETDQQNTSPTPYLSGADGQWSNLSTWARDVWYVPNELGTDNSTIIDWNITQISHNIYSGNKDITVLGLLSMQNTLDINPDHFIRISHYLLLNGNMDLEGESQLLQDHGSILDNTSSGWLEANQEGKLSSFNYNYWTSPVSNQRADNNYGYNLGTVLFTGDKENNPDGINFQDGYYAADGPKTTPEITISNEWIWDFRGGVADVYNNWQFMGSDFDQIVGAGYSMKGTDGTVGPNEGHQKYTFKGKPNNGNIPTSGLSTPDPSNLELSTNQNYLVGNPYPSAIDAQEFMNDNLTGGRSVFNGALYFWDHFSGSTHILAEYIGGYAVYNLSGAVSAATSIDARINNTGQTSNNQEPGQFIPIGQGFFLNSAPVGSNTFGGEIIFKNTQRIYVEESPGVSVFKQEEGKKIKGQSSEANADTRTKIRVKFESPKGYHRQILVTRDENTSNGFDIGYDAPLIDNIVEDMYWWVDNNGFVIQGVPNFEKEQVLPLAIKTNAGGEFKIKIDQTENWPSGKELYLKDKLSDTIHDILKQDYTAKTENAGEITDRFELVFFKQQEQNQDPVIPDPDDIADPNPDDLPYIDNLVGISYSTFSKQIKISNFDLIDVDKVMVFDMGGKLIQVFDELPTIEEIRLGMQPVRSGVYVVKVIGEQGVTDKKIIIK